MQVEIQTGMRVALFVPQSIDENAKKTVVLHSIVEEVPDEKNIIIQVPMHKGYFYPLPRIPVSMRFFHDLVPYSILVQFEERIRREQFMFARMRRLSEIEQHQMREHFRLRCDIPVSIERLKDGEEESIVSKARALDISEGGMLVLTDQDVQQGEKVGLSFSLVEQESLEAYAMRIQQNENMQNYKIGFRFKHQNRAQMNRIYKYVLQEQMSQRQRD